MRWGVIFAAENVGLKRCDTVEEKQTVEVVDFVENEAGFEVAGFDRNFFTVWIEGEDADVLRAFHVGC